MQINLLDKTEDNTYSQQRFNVGVVPGWKEGDTMKALASLLLLLLTVVLL